MNPDELRKDLHQHLDSLYAEHGEDGVNRTDIEEMIEDVFYGL